ncbi:MAG: hypothetical protein MJY87_02410 [Fibrobacter sp.]|nr:hypothetical protein [Fibrobacter sp.]
MPRVISVPGFIGGSNRSDVMMDSPEYLLNMFVEKTEAAENRGYTGKRLRSVEGERAVLEFPFETKIGCRGLFTASDGSIFAAFDSKVYRITMKDDGSMKYRDVADLQSTEVSGLVGRPTKVVFAETGGIDSNVIWVDGSSTLFAYSLTTGKFSMYMTPLRVYQHIDGREMDQESHASPTHVVCVAGVICINDSGNDTWYYTDPYVLGSDRDERSAYRLDANDNVVYKDDGVTVETRTVRITDQAANGVSYLWLDRYSLPKYQTAEYVADRITAMVLSGDRIFCFGEKSLQVYALTETADAYGNSYSVFSSTGNNTRDNGAEIGATVATLGGNVFWLGSSTVGEHSVWMSAGGSPTRISSNVMEREIRSLEYVGDAYGFAYAYNGHQFYVLTFPSAGRTFCYDHSTGEWFNRGTRDRDTGEDLHWFPAFAVSAYSQVYLGSYSAQYLVQVDPDKFTDYKDDPIVKQRVSPVFVKDFEPFRLDAFWMEWGTGVVDDPDLNPVAMLEASGDGGNTWGDETWGHGGKAGQHFWRTEWRRCFPAGDDELPRMYVLRVTISDPVKVVITGAKMQITECRRR